MFSFRVWSIAAVVGVAGLVAPAGARASAEWTANIGYHNPVISTYGLNFLYFGQNLGFEIGLGWIDVQSESTKESDDASNTKKSTGTSLHLAGDLDVKYFLSSGKFRPYIQAGVAYGVGASTESGASAGTGGGFAGLGIMAGTPDLYLYGAYDLNSSRDGFVQAGIGTSI